MENDKRSPNCRQRRIDEGKAYSRGSCDVCGWKVFNGSRIPQECVEESERFKMTDKELEAAAVKPHPLDKPAINRITRDDVGYFLKFVGGGNAENAVDLYQCIATKSAFYPGKGTPLGLDYVALKLNGEAGEFAEHVGKAMRDDDLMPVEEDHLGNKFIILNRKLTDDRRAALIKEAGDVLWYVSAIARELGLTLSEVAARNLEKLCDRGERDKMRGSGDDR